MRPLRLLLEGFYGVRDGMKRDSVELDLESLPTGLIALTGPNGAGKTTIMDNLHPYRIMPSRASKLSVDAFSYWDHVCGVQARKEFEWEHDGLRYRSTFVFRKPGKTGKADYFLFYRSMDGEWRPVSLPDGTVSDGKGETYDRCVDAICGSLESFFTSVFSAQNRRPLASYGATEIKGLLAELLKIDHLRALSTKAADVAKELSRKLGVVQQELAAFSGKRERVDETRKALATAAADIAAAREKRTAAQAEIATLTQQHAVLVAKQGENASTVARIGELGVRRSQLQASLQTLERDKQADDKRFDQRASALRETIAGHVAVVRQAEQIRGAAAARDEAQLRVAKAEALIEPLQRAIEQLDAKRLRVASVESTLSGLESQGTAKSDLIRTLTEQSSVIGSVPCAGMDIHAMCPLLAQARNAAQQVDVQTASLKDLRARYRQHQTELKELAPSVEALLAKRTELQQVNTELTGARQALQRATDLAARKRLLDAAEAGLTKAQGELESLDVERSEASKRRETESTRLTGLLRDVDAEVSRLAAVDVTQAIVEVDRQLVARRDVCTAMDARIEALIRTQATCETTLAALERELEGFSATQAFAERISDEVAQWKLLAKGLGNDGVIALTIDDAGPALTQTVNDLLLACYGTRFTVEIQTQRTLANGETREGFEILVHDADSDSSKAVGVMSGGQKVWINECLTRGVALYIAGNAGQPYESLFSDESDGPLDPDRKVQFMRMKREVLRQGGYAREFFISQTPDLIAEADAVIDVAALAR
ncbi:TPA: SMC family ATPase [Burkholderia cenocepacia]|uniref:Putative ATPase involved in DNA repair n=1 Tax=Burkholderia latens TaxID=488446 RepID=A0A6H9THU6_9BURK|nr:MULTISPECIES: SMC family ATPase [Burkholderia]KAB0644567.1 SMC family ATPase [Burkholderia latens]MBJ9920602.1 SMC family ATPase [Burkholderia cenocepacia]UJH78717.1 SMC family ATPase [Burkholderia cenocepacia]VWB20248.1 putative ATPase involved in DNA repair [Burkholderia latens]HDR9879722.1 SMC family ATPase [Burkholderia cenocepacia]